MPEPQLSTPPSRSSVPITFEQVKELVSSLFDTFTYQLHNIQSQNIELKNEMQGLRAQNSELKDQMNNQFSDSRHEVLSLKTQNSELKEQLQNQTSELRTQNQHLQHQLESLKASSSTVSSPTLATTISDDTILKITKAVGDELHDRLKKISNQIQAVYKNVDDNSMLTRKLQKKFQARALSLENKI